MAPTHLRDALILAVVIVAVPVGATVGDLDHDVIWSGPGGPNVALDATGNLFVGPPQSLEKWVGGDPSWTISYPTRAGGSVVATLPDGGVVSGSTVTTDGMQPCQVGVCVVQRTTPSGDVVWRVPTPGASQSWVHVNDIATDGIIVALATHQFGARAAVSVLDAATGALQWRIVFATAGDDQVGGVAVSDGDVIATGAWGTSLIRNGAVTWTSPVAGRSVAAEDGRVSIVTGSELVQLVNGEESWRVSVPGHDVVLHRDRAVVASSFTNVADVCAGLLCGGAGPVYGYVVTAYEDGMVQWHLRHVLGPWVGSIRSHGSGVAVDGGRLALTELEWDTIVVAWPEVYATSQGASTPS